MTFAEELRRVAVHEAAHATLVEHFSGVPASIGINVRSRNGAAWPAGGYCDYTFPASWDARRYIALAGACGEVLDNPHYGCNSGDALLNPIIARISSPDAVQAGHYTRRDIDETLAVCWRLWPSIEARAQREIAAFNQRAAVVVACA